MNINSLLLATLSVGNAMEISLGNRSNAFKDHAFTGIATATLSAPWVHGFYRIFLVSIQKQIPSKEAVQLIYQGRIEPEASQKSYPFLKSFKKVFLPEKGTPSPIHYTKGMTPFLLREYFRTIFNAAANMKLRPLIEEHFDATETLSAEIRARHAFAFSIALTDGFLNFFDVMKGRRQIGKLAIPSIEEAKGEGQNRIQILYRGTIVTIFRQYLISNLLYETTPKAQKITNTLGVNPKEPLGLALQSGIQTPITLAGSILLERTKNLVQLAPFPSNKSRYISAFQLIHKQGIKGITHGIVPRIISLYGAIVGFNFMALQMQFSQEKI